MILPAGIGPIVLVSQSSLGSVIVALLEGGGGQYGRRSRPGGLGSYKVWKHDQLFIDRRYGRSVLYAPHRHHCPADKVENS